MNKEKIFVSAFACDPTIGSEPGVGWHWVLELSKYYELWVLTVANDHGSIEEKVKEYFETHKLKCNIHFIYYDLLKPFLLMKKNIMSMRIYYILWQYCSNKIVQLTMERNNIKIFHLLTYGNMLWPISKYGQDMFFIWGPTGGMDVIESEYSKHYSLRSRMFEFIRRFIVNRQVNSQVFKNKCNHADLILCKANSSYKIIDEENRKKAFLFTDVAMDSFESNYSSYVSKKQDGLLFFAAGHMDAWRGFDFLIEVFVSLHCKYPNNQLIIVGKGTELRYLQNKIRKLNADSYIKLPGEVSMEEYQNLMRNADVVINSCLKEGAVTNAFDCMRWGKPFICVETGGYTRNFDNDSAIILPRNVDRETMIHNLSNAIEKMINPETRQKYAKNICKRGELFTWKNKGMEFKTILDNYLTNGGSNL